MDPILIIIMFVVICSLTIAGTKTYNVYNERVLVPRARMQLLEDTVDKIAAHNVSSVTKDGNNHRQAIVKDSPGKELAKSFQEAFGSTRQLPPQISLAEALREDHPINERIGSPFKSQRREPFHTGPYAHELTNDEWAFIQEYYQKAIQRITDNQIRLDANLNAVAEIESQLHRQMDAYSQARKQIANPNKDPYEQEFEALNSASVEDKKLESKEPIRFGPMSTKTILHPDPFEEGSEDIEPVEVKKKRNGSSESLNSQEKDGSVDNNEQEFSTVDEYRQAKLEQAAVNYKKMQESIESSGVKSKMSPRELEREIDREWG